MTCDQDIANVELGSRFGWRGVGLGLFCSFHALEFFAGLEANGFAGWDVDFFAGAGIAADAGLAGLDAEDAKAAELDTLAAAKSLLERFEDGFDSLLGFRATDKSLGDNRIDDVQLDHKRLPLPRQMLEGAAQVVKTRWVNYTVLPFDELIFNCN
jgi:hypothetical protein